MRCLHSVFTRLPARLMIEQLSKDQLEVIRFSGFRSCSRIGMADATVWQRGERSITLSTYDRKYRRGRG